MTDPKGSVRWGILSTARINSEVLPAFGKTELSDLVAVASRSIETAQAYAAKYSIPMAYGSYEELLSAADIECVYISVPNSLHAEWTRRALEAGKHVLCEKPLTPTAAEASELYSLAEERALVLDEAFMYRHHPQMSRCLELVRDGSIGAPRFLRCSFHFRVEDPGADIRYRPELAGGSLRDVGSYCVSFANFIADAAPVSVEGVSRRSSFGVDERFFATLTYDSGLVAQFDCSMDTSMHVGALVLGSDGSLSIPNPWYPDIASPWLPAEPPMKLILRCGTDVKEIATGARNAYLEEIDNVAQAIRGKPATLVPPAETIRNLETIERLLEQGAVIP